MTRNQQVKGMGAAELTETRREHRRARGAAARSGHTVVQVGRLSHPAAVVVGGALVLAACTGSTSQAVPTPTAEPSVAPSAVPEEYPDSITRYLDRLASTPRPVENSAMPPRHLDEEVFPTALVDRSLIVSGGPPPDGIPPIDEPRFEVADTVDWLQPDEPVLALLLEGEARAYPVQVMIWHEIVNDVVAGLPVTVTYCPLCNSGAAFDRRIGSEVLDFGTSGGLYQANLVMYDRQTESLWTQFDGRSVIGTRVGDELTLLPISTVSWKDFLRDHPDGTVLARDDVNPRPYGRNPYNAYDQRDAPVPGFYTGEPDGTLAPFERVVGVELEDEAVAVPTRSLTEVGVTSTELSGRAISFWHLPGTNSSLNHSEITSGEDIGSTGVFFADGEVFERVGDVFVDDATGSTWNILGEAVAGPRRGDRLEPITHVDTFWFAWSTFQVDASVFDPTRS